jgi:hypothetical protein
VGESELAHRLREQLAFVAGTSRHVLLLGPSGTGKELAARAIHGLSSRRAKIFVSRNAPPARGHRGRRAVREHAKGYPNPGMPERLGLLRRGRRVDALPRRDRRPPRAAAGASAACASTTAASTSASASRARDARRSGSSRPRTARCRFAQARLPRALHAPHHAPEPRRASRRRAARGAFALGPGRARRRVDREALLRAPWGALAEARIAPELVTRLLRHRFTHNVRELDRLLWLAIGGARETTWTSRRRSRPSSASRCRSAMPWRRASSTRVDRARAARGERGQRLRGGAFTRPAQSLCAAPPDEEAARCRRAKETTRDPHGRPRLLRETLDLALSSDDRFPARFYEILFERHPDLEALFTRNSRGAQIRSFGQASSWPSSITSTTPNGRAASSVRSPRATSRTVSPLCDVRAGR